MTARAVVAIFAKAPVSGRVKTRLAATIGDAAALEFYRSSLAGVIGRLADRPDWDLEIRVTPDDAVGDPVFVPCRTAGQGDGDLGDRLHRVLGRATPRRPVVVIGADVPEIAPNHIAEALEALSDHDLAIGPSPDGGFWAIGASRPPPAGLFDGVRWSTRHALADTAANAAGLSLAFISSLEDVDDEAGLARLQARRAT